MPAKRKSEKEKGADMPFKKGDKVQARWSGSNRYYDAKVLDMLDNKNCKVQFDDGSVFSIKISDVKIAEQEEEVSSRTTRTRTRSRSQSAGRKMQSRSRSPSRRAKKEVVERKEKLEKKSASKPEKKIKKLEENSNSLVRDEVDRSGVKTRHSAERMAMVTVTKNNSTIKEVHETREEVSASANAVHLRASSRLATLHAQKAFEKAVENRSSTPKRNAVSKDGAKYSDDEEEDDEVKVVQSKPKRSVQIVFFVMTLLKIIVIPASLLLLIFACTRKQCTILEVPQFYAKWKDFENAVRLPFMAVAGFHAVQCVLSLLPLGWKAKGFPSISGEPAKEYRLNGIVSLLMCAAMFGGCTYFGISMNWGFDKFRSIAVSSYLYCLVWSLVLHLMALMDKNATRYSKVPFLGRFYDGCYVNPVVFKVIDLKTSFVRTGLIGLVLLNSSILLKFYLSKGYVATPLCLTTAMQNFFVLDLLLREEKFLSTATYTSDSVGYGFILSTGFSAPLGLGLQNVFNFIHSSARPTTTPHWCSAAMVALFLCGYYIYLTSSNMKHNFRRNPYAPSLTEVDSIPTSKKKRLICWSWWQRVRHPNYLGLLIMAVAWTLPCGFSHFVPFGPFILLAGALIVRSYRVENECGEKYGPAWNNYTDKVRSRLIPYIF